jgi:hypothetical protein
LLWTTNKLPIFKDDNIVLSVFDSNQDGQIDTWLRFDNNGELDLEVYDSDFDNKIDTVHTIKEDAIEETLKEPEFKVEDFVVPDNPNPQPKTSTVSEEINNENEFFVLNPPPSEEKSKPFSWIKWLLLIAGAGLIAWLYHRKQKHKD